MHQATVWASRTVGWVAIALASLGLPVCAALVSPSNLRIAEGNAILLPNLVAQLQNQSVMAGQNAIFSVNASGSALSYQWTLNGLNLASSNTCTITNCQLSYNGAQVQVTIANSLGSVTSSATLTVNPPGTNYFVATNGLIANTGLTTNSPWPLSYAVTQLGPGITLTLMPGIYPGPVEIYYVNGTAASPAVVRSQYKWQAVIANSTNRGVEVWSSQYVVLDGLCVSNCFNTGIKVMDSHNTVRHCWSTHNGNVSDQSGIESNTTGNTNNLFEYNLLEYNGSGAGFGHGIYVSGQNNVIRGNVVRHNGAFGIQVYTGVTGTWQNHNLVYNNLVYGHTNKYGVTIWGADGTGSLPGTNYLLNNTILDGVSLYYGAVWVTNNIILPSLVDPQNPVSSSPGNPPVVSADYNFGTVAINPAGAHNLITNVAASAIFVNPAQGLYWLATTSPPRKAAASQPLPVDFFGNTQATSADLGAVQYNAALLGDTRVLDPASVTPDYWSLP